ncbi:MAG: hypothetical protein WCO09_01440, partial [bacterium]
SHIMFFLMYMSRYMTHPTAKFQQEIFKITEDRDTKLVVLSAFRGSAKSTICTTSNALWSVVSGRSHFVIIVSQTLQQARHHLAGIISMIDSNPLLKNDLGPLITAKDEQGAFSITFEKYDAKILAVSVGQNVRGIHHNQYRPDLILCDDVEDTSSVKTRDGRNKTYEWFESDIIPLGDEKTRIFLLGTPLHENSLLMQLIKEIKGGQRDGIFRRYPFLDEEGNALWPERYPTKEDVEKKRRSIVSKVFWEREYMLRIVDEEDQVILREWIKYYDKIPDINDPNNRYVGTFSGVDLASTISTRSDYSSVVSVRVFGYGNERRYYVLPNPVNVKMLYPHLIQKLKEVSLKVGNGVRTTMYVEKVAFQSIVADDLRASGFNAHGVSVTGDKHERLSLISPVIENNKVLFPRNSCEELIDQMVHFGFDHDDLCDAFVLVLSELEREKPVSTGELARLNPHLMRVWHPEDDDYDKRPRSYFGDMRKKIF